jgi:hypothetical protein
VEQGRRRKSDHYYLTLHSPKSLYRLADKLGIDSLTTLAEHQILQSLTPENALAEAAGPFSAVFDKVCQMGSTAVSTD